ncbi:MAG: insulinase family protein [Bryobacter sp.]|nr:insulinase family protein [Bryobacter sp.]
MRILAVPLLAMTLTAANPPQKIFPYAYDQHDFPNGLRLVTIPTDYPNVVSLYLVVQTGSRNEVEAGKSGFAHLFEHMMFRGTKNTPPAKYEAAMKDAGSSGNAYTDDDLTCYHLTFSKEDLEKMLALEADRFQHLEYSTNVFKTETTAVLGEYNKNYSAPQAKLEEVLRDTAFDRHTYKHTTMGFLRDIEAMPTLFDYSRQFFDRYYRPEYTTILIVGDVKPAETRKLVEKHFGGWKRGNFRPEIPAEPPQTGPRKNHIPWPAATLPWLALAHKGAAYSDTAKDQPALDMMAQIGFGPTSAIYRKLVLEEQKVDIFFVDNGDRVDPCLFTVYARLKDKKHQRYSFAATLDNSESIASIVARYIALRRTPETINQLYNLYDSLTPADLQAIARKYFTEASRTTVTLTGAEK